MVTAYRPSNPTAYLAQQPELLSGFAILLCESTGLDRRGSRASILSLRSERLDLREQPGVSERDDDKHTQRNGNEAANWQNSGINAAVMTFAAYQAVNDGSPSPRSNRRCWSHGGRISP